MTEHVLVINAGSSSLKYSLVDSDSGDPAATGLVERIGEQSSHHVHHGPKGDFEDDSPVASHEEALEAAVRAFETYGPALGDVDIVAVGHRVVHGGSQFAAPAPVDDALIAAVTELVPLAPLHNPANLEGIKVARRLLPELPHVAVFDTAFHQTLPPYAYRYAVPFDWLKEYGIRRYGFHGTSHAFVSERAAQLLGRGADQLNLIVLHLGNGCSAAAIRRGNSVDTSMGLTPLEGLVMGTRSGDLDPAVHGHLARVAGQSAAETDRILNSESGLKGLTGENDFRELTRRRAAGDDRARLAFDLYCYRIKKYVGAYYAVLGTVDAIVFTAGVGQHSAEARAAALSDLDGLGIQVDPVRNTATTEGVISTDGSRVKVLVVPTNEEWQIAREALAVVRG
ncbi:acetate/propionate family kinase [Kribbella solani]|uniref:acetate/propionate family kinase n=1 Tax=Kribbella solani TaxID=236067 RepID=UPI0029A39687|nr:acetate kinase [Kribbella solani]MDX2967877.1 acetate kinase [Kribbella solani]